MMNEPYKVSLLIPIFGVEKYIERCTLSLLNQTYQNIEYIFVDDCCSDNSVNILQNVVKRYPYRCSNIRIIRHKCNRGLAAARNTAISAATGDYIIHVDSDDYMKTDAVEKLVRKQQETLCDIVCADYYQISSSGKVRVKCVKESQGKSMCLKILSSKVRANIWNKLINIQLYRKYNIKTIEGHNMGEDYQVTPLLYYYSEKVSSVNEPLYYYSRENESSYMNAEFSEKKAETESFSYYYIVNIFSDKEKEFQDASKQGLLRCLIGSLDDIGKVGGHDEYFKKVRKEIMSMDLYFKSLSLRHQIAIQLSFSKILFTVYIKLGSFIINAFNKIRQTGI